MRFSARELDIPYNVYNILFLSVMLAEYISNSYRPIIVDALIFSQLNRTGESHRKVISRIALEKDFESGHVILIIPWWLGSAGLCVSGAAVLNSWLSNKCIWHGPSWPIAKKLRMTFYQDETIIQYLAQSLNLHKALAATTWATKARWRGRYLLHSLRWPGAVVPLPHRFFVSSK